MATLRPFRPDDAAAGHALTTAFGWPHRAEDWAVMARLGTGVVAEDRAVIGTALRWPFGPDFATIGMICVRPDRQGEGLGRRLTEHVLLPGTTVLHATEAGRPLYAKLGFVAEGVVRQYQGIVQAGDTTADPRLRPFAPADLAAIVALDAQAAGMDRAALVAALAGDGVVLLAGGVTAGFAILRPFGRGAVVGPVAARNAAEAWAMVAALLDRRTGHFVRVDVPEASGLVPRLAARGLADAGPALRMVRGTPPRPGAVQVFALASQAWG